MERAVFAVLILTLTSCAGLTFAQEVPANEIRLGAIPVVGGSIGYARRLSHNEGMGLWLSCDVYFRFTSEGVAWILPALRSEQAIWLLLSARSERAKGWGGELGLGWTRREEEKLGKENHFSGLGWQLGVIYRFSKTTYWGVRLWGSLSGSIDTNAGGIYLGFNF